MNTTVLKKNPGVANRQKRKELLDSKRGQGRIPGTRIETTGKRKAYERSSRNKIRVADFN